MTSHKTAAAHDVLSEVQLFADGACSGNPGPGGWAFILRHEKTGKEKESSGGERETTNNRMELTAVIRGLEALKTANLDRAGDRQHLCGQGRLRVAAQMEGQRLAPPLKAAAGPKSKTKDLWRRLDELLQPSSRPLYPTSAATAATSRTSVATLWPSRRIRSSCEGRM